AVPDTSGFRCVMPTIRLSRVYAQVINEPTRSPIPASTRTRSTNAMTRPHLLVFMILAWLVPARSDEKLKPAGSKGTDASCETCCCSDEGEPHRVFELRTYYLNEGKLGDLHKRFRDHTCQLLKKHGAELIGFWTPTDEKDGKNDKLIYLVAF